jgi:hypothetical protein
MEPSYFSFNSYTIQLSSPPPLSTQIVNLTGGTVQGTTRFVVDYNLLDFTSKPYKVIIDWGNGSVQYLNDIFVYDSEVDPLSTFSPMLSSLSYAVVSPISIQPLVITPTIDIYYENGIIHYFRMPITMCSDNIIDLDLNILDIQNTGKTLNTIYNLGSSKGNVVYNVTDLELDSNSVV